MNQVLLNQQEKLNNGCGYNHYLLAGDLAVPHGGTPTLVPFVLPSAVLTTPLDYYTLNDDGTFTILVDGVYSVAAVLDYLAASAAINVDYDCKISVESSLAYNNVELDRKKVYYGKANPSDIASITSLQFVRRLYRGDTIKVFILNLDPGNNATVDGSNTFLDISRLL